MHECAAATAVAAVIVAVAAVPDADVIAPAIAAAAATDDLIATRVEWAQTCSSRDVNFPSMSPNVSSECRLSDPSAKLHWPSVLLSPNNTPKILIRFIEPGDEPQTDRFVATFVPATSLCFVLSENKSRRAKVRPGVCKQDTASQRPQLPTQPGIAHGRITNSVSSSTSSSSSSAKSSTLFHPSSFSFEAMIAHEHTQLTQTKQLTTCTVSTVRQI